MTASLARFEASANRTAANPLENTVGEAVEGLEAETGVRIHAAVLRAADEMTGTLLNILV